MQTDKIYIVACMDKSDKQHMFSNDNLSFSKL